MRAKWIVFISMVLLLSAGCSKRSYFPTQLPLHTVEFSDPEVLAAYKDLRIPKSQLLSNPVLQDLERQEKNGEGKTSFEIQALEQARYLELSRLVREFVTRTLLTEAASSSGMDVDQYVKKNISKASKTVSDKEFAKFMDGSDVSILDLDDKTKEKLKQSFQEKKYRQALEEHVALKLLDGSVDVAFSRPNLTLKLSEEFKELEGPKDAPISMIVFSDLFCPDCEKVVRHVSRALKEYKGYLRLNWIFHFDQNDGLSRLVAESSQCVSKQDDRKVYEFIKDFSGDGSQVGVENFESWVLSKKLDKDHFLKCLNSGEMRALVNQHLLYANAVGELPFPAVWIGGTLLDGSLRWMDIEQIIEREIKEKKISPWSVWWRNLFRFQVLFRV